MIKHIPRTAKLLHSYLTYILKIEQQLFHSLLCNQYNSRANYKDCTENVEQSCSHSTCGWEDGAGFIEDFDFGYFFFLICNNFNNSCLINLNLYRVFQLIVSSWLLCLSEVVCTCVKTLDCEFTGILCSHSAIFCLTRYCNTIEIALFSLRSFYRYKTYSL